MEPNAKVLIFRNAKLCVLGFISWDQARDDCHQKGGFLVEIDSKVSCKRWKLKADSYFNLKRWINNVQKSNVLGGTGHPGCCNGLPGLGKHNRHRWRPHWSHRGGRHLAVGKLWEKSHQLQRKLGSGFAKWWWILCWTLGMAPKLGIWVERIGGGVLEWLSLLDENQILETFRSNLWDLVNVHRHHSESGWQKFKFKTYTWIQNESKQ